MRTTRSQGRHAGRGSAAQRRQARRARKVRQLSWRVWLTKGWRRWWTPSPALSLPFVGLELAALLVLSAALLLSWRLLTVDAFTSIWGSAVLLPFALSTLRDVVFLIGPARTSAHDDQSNEKHPSA